MDDIRSLFSRLKKDLKHQMRGRIDNLDITGAKDVEERVYLLSRPEPRVAAGDHDREGSRARTDGQKVHSSDRSPQLEPVPAGVSDNNRKGFSRRRSRLDPNPEFVVDNEPRRGAGRIYPSPPPFLISTICGPDSTRTFPFRVLSNCS